MRDSVTPTAKAVVQRRLLWLLAVLALLVVGAAAVPAVAAAAEGISGTVRNENGTTVGGITVTAYRPDGSGGWTAAGTTTTSSLVADRGTYSLVLAVGAYRVEFKESTPAVYAPQWFSNKVAPWLADDVIVNSGVVTANINAVLAWAGHITGLVTSAVPAPLSGITVEAWRSDGAGGWQRFASAATGADGRYDITGLSTDTYRVHFVDDPSGAYVQQWYTNWPTIDLANSVAVTAGNTTADVNATLARAGSVGGTVRDQFLAGVAGITVTAFVADGAGGWREVGRTTTGALGAYTLVGLPAGNCRIRFSAGSDSYITQYYNDKSSLTAADNVAVVAGALTPGIDARLIGIGHIAGAVKDVAGGGLPGIRIAAYKPDGAGGWAFVAAGTTGADGAYDLAAVPAGTYRVLFQDPTGDYAFQYFSNKPAIGSANDVVVTTGGTATGINAVLAAAGHITGTVTRSAAPVAALVGITVQAYRDNGAAGWPSVALTHTVTGGSYDLDGLPAGTYRVEFRDSAGHYAVQYYNAKATFDLATAVTVATGATVSGVNAALIAAPGHIQGKVTRAGGTALSGIGVSALQPDGTGGWATISAAVTGADGTYDLAGLAGGQYRVRFRDPAGVYVTQFFSAATTVGSGDDVVVNDGSITSGVDAVLAANPGRISGVARFGGAGQGGLRVTAYMSDGPGAWSFVDSAVTGPTGAYEIRGLAPGAYRVEFLDPNGRFVTQFFNGVGSIAAGTDVVVPALGVRADVNATLLEYGHIAGTVTGTAAAVLPGIWVGAYRSNGAGGWDFVNFALTGDLGIYDIGALPAGTYRVAFVDSGGVYATQYFSGKWSLGTATDVIVAGGATVRGIDAALTRACGIGGTVTAATGSGPLAGIQVDAYLGDGAGGWIVRTVYTKANGTYQFTDLPAGDYRLTFYDQAGTWARQWYNGKTSLSLADVVSVAAGGTQSGIDAALWPKPTITSFTPGSGYAGTGVTITGTNFTGATSVRFNTRSTTSFTASDTQISVTVPVGATTGRITVVTPHGSATSAGTYTVLPTPVVTVTAPMASSSWPSGSTQTVSWTLSAAVSVGEFHVWLVSPGGSWYIDKQVLPVAGRTSYSTSLIANVPAAAGYKAYVYWRPTVGTGAWVATARSAAFTITPINITSPTAASSWPMRSTQTITWTTNPSVSVGEFRVWLVSGSSWYLNKQVLAVAGQMSYSTTVTVAVDYPGTYQAYVYYRPTVGSGSWTATARSASFTVTPVPPVVTVTSPIVAVNWPQGSSQNVSWSVAPSVAFGEFRVCMLTGGGTAYAVRLLPAVAGQTLYTTAVTVDAPLGSGYRAQVAWRPVVGSGTWVTTDGPAVITVTTLSPALTITAPSGTGSYPVGTNLTVNWTSSIALAWGEFGVWVRSAGGSWYINRMVPASGGTGFTTTFPLAVPTGTGYQAILAWRPLVGTGDWVSWATQTGSFTVTP